MISDSEEELFGFGEGEVPCQKNLLIDAGLQEEELFEPRILETKEGDGETHLRGKRKKALEQIRKRDKLAVAAKDWGTGRFKSLR